MLGIAGLLAAGTATAAEPVLPLGTDGHGIHLTQKRVGKPPYRHEALVLTFDATAADRYRQVAGRWLNVSCSRFDRHPGLFGVGASGSSEQRAPRHMRPIDVMDGGRYDVCAVGVRHGRRTTTIARIPLTLLGAQRLDEHNVAVVVVAAIHTLARPERPSAATVAETFHGVALAAPTDAPSPGVLGVYSDGAEHVYAAQVDLGGELLFVELDGAVTRSNVTDYLLGEDPMGLDF